MEVLERGGRAGSRSSPLLGSSCRFYFYGCTASSLPWCSLSIRNPLLPVFTLSVLPILVVVFLPLISLSFSSTSFAALVLPLCQSISIVCLTSLIHRREKWFLTSPLPLLPPAFLHFSPPTMASSLVPTRRLALISRHLSRPSLVPSLLSSLSSLPSSFSSPSRSHSSSTSSGPSSTGAKSTTAKYPYTYTTSTSLHGKPSPPSPRKSRLTQGLPDSHPLVKWREDQLKETGAPKPQGAGHDWFFVEGIQRGTEELEEGEKGVRGVVLGVADGVGGWEDQGVDPSHFSQVRFLVFLFPSLLCFPSASPYFLPSTPPSDTSPFASPPLFPSPWLSL